MDLELRDKAILISGGAAGIGGAISAACAAEGAVPIILDRNEEVARAFAAQLRSVGHRCELILLDLKTSDDCRLAVEDALRLCGRIDALVNNAGINDSVGLEHGNPERFAASVHSNLMHYYALAHYALPALKLTSGSIVNIASKVALTGQGNTSGYAAAKGAQLALTREWAVELLPLGIRVNAIVPAEVMTPLYRQWIATFPEPEQKLQSIERNIPLGHRLTTPEEIAATAVFLLSPRSSHTTGQFLHVDGGYLHRDRAL